MLIVSHVFFRAVPFFFFSDAATTEIYTLSLHDALPISRPRRCTSPSTWACCPGRPRGHGSRCRRPRDRKSTRLNSSHSQISYAVFCLKKKKKMVIHCACPLLLRSYYITISLLLPTAHRY